MANYHYRALDKEGLEQSGTIEADSEKQARTSLRTQMLIPLELKTITNKKYYQIQWIKPFTSHDLCLFTRQLATLIQAGLPIEQSLQTIANQIKKNKFKNIILNLRHQVLEGSSLSQAFSTHKPLFSELYCTTIHTGEQTGRLSLVLKELAFLLEQQQTMQQTIRQALIYPLFMLSVSIMIIVFLLTYVVPGIINIFQDNQQILPITTRILLMISSFLIHDGWLFLLFLILSVIFFHYFSKKENFRKHWQNTLLKLPILGKLLVTINTGRYANTFSILFNAGVPVIETMRISADLINNLVLKKRIQQAGTLVREGSSIHHALSETNSFSPMMLQLIASGEASGRLGELMNYAANVQQENVTRLLKSMLSLLEPVIILFMGVFVLFIVLAILLPIFGMNELV